MTIRNSRLAALGALAAVLALGACKGGEKAEQAAAPEPTAASSEFVAENPSEAAVPVNLPTTAMTNAPASEAAPAASAAPAKP